jgi:DNA-binding LacI/PurR family transcriptional regulator
MGDHERHYTMNDIAKKAQVSLSTVSRVLNNSAPVKRETRKAVLDAIKEFDFIPNALARGLATNTSKSIGFIIPEVLNPFYPELLQSVEEVASANGFFLEMYVSKMDPERERYFLNEMISRRTGGVIFMCSKINDMEYIKRVKKKINIVSLQSDIPGVDFVDTESRKGTRQAIEHLIGLGHRKIAFIGYRLDIQALDERLAGYKEALKKHNIDERHEYILDGGSMSDSGYVMTKKLLSLEDPPTAIHCFNEYVTTGAYRAVNELKLSIPRDISISGMDNLKIAKILNPPLTTVAQPVESMGRIATELLIKNIKNGNIGVHQKIILPTELIIRSSTAPPKRA